MNLKSVTGSGIETSPLTKDEFVEHFPAYKWDVLIDNGLVYLSAKHGVYGIMFDAERITDVVAQLSFECMTSSLACLCDELDKKETNR